MKFVIEIEIGNDMIQRTSDVIGALGRVVDKLRQSVLRGDDERLREGMHGHVRDTRGNTVGFWVVTKG